MAPAREVRGILSVQSARSLARLEAFAMENTMEDTVGWRPRAKWSESLCVLRALCGKRFG